jgi:cytochrome bd ubiquinol oxidase subunit II
MDLNTLWFVLIVVLFAGFFFLEGFDYGVGMLLPFIAKDDRERRAVFNAIGPFWDGNEVWLLTAGGAIFAAFPHWYATLFSGFYLALVFVLLALIVRGVSFEFRSKDRHPAWRATWDWMLFAGSLVPALLWGVAVGNLIKGVPIDQTMDFVGGFFDLLSPYTLLAGLVSLSLFAIHGAIFLNLKTTGLMSVQARYFALRLWLPTVVIVFGFGAYSYFAIDLFARRGINPGIAPIAAGMALLGVRPLLRAGRCGWAFAATGIAIVGFVLTVFSSLYPRVMVSSLDQAWSLTIYNASSSRYTLTVMSVVALCFVPAILAYQGWTYWTFRKRVSVDGELEY